MIQYPIEEINSKKYLRILRSVELTEKSGKKIHFDNSDDIYEVAVFRIDGKLYCVNNHCPHQNAPEIFNGILDDIKVTCPLHGWSYYLDDGRNAEPKRGLKKLSCFEIFEKNGYIYIEIPNIPIPKWRR